MLSQRTFTAGGKAGAATQQPHFLRLELGAGRPGRDGPLEVAGPCPQRTAAGKEAGMRTFAPQALQGAEGCTCLREQNRI
jgi:hypothetical protein